MDDFVITEDIFKESLSLTECAYHITEDIYRESLLEEDGLRREIAEVYQFSGRYWVWKMDSFTYKHLWKYMVRKGEIQLDAPGFKDFMSYADLAEFKDEFESLHPDKSGITSKPISYYYFAKSLINGDVIIVRSCNDIIGWGVIDSSYSYNPLRSLGCHSRKISWFRIHMPFIFLSKRPVLYQIPDEETHLLKETLISKSVIEGQELPLPFMS